MFGLTGIKMALIGVAVGVIGLAYWQYTVMKTDLETSRANVAKMEVAKLIQDDTIAAQLEALAKWEVSFTELQETAMELQEVRLNATSESRRLNEIFAKHDMEALSASKPDALERLVNRGTRDVFRMFERETARNIYNPDRDTDAGPDAGTP